MSIVFTLLLSLLSFGALQLPLSQHLGYEYSLLMAVAAALLFGVSTIMQADASLWQLLRRHLIMVLLPWLIAVVHDIYYGSCGFWQGCAWYLLLPVVTTIYATAVAIAARRWWRKTATAMLFYYSWLMASLLFTTARVFFGVALYAFNPFFGYFPGPIYDTVVSLTAPLLTYRLLVLLMACWWMLLDRQSFRRLLHPRKIIWGMLSFILLAWMGREQSLGYYTSRDQLRRQLAGKIHTPQFDIYYSKSMSPQFNAEQFRDDCEYELRKLSQQLQLKPQHFTIYLFADAEEKKRLTGAGNTLIGNPIHRELFLLETGFPDSSLLHEMTHVVAADIGIPWLGLGRSPLLMEGLAVYVSRQSLEPRLEQQAKAILSATALPLNRWAQGIGFFQYHAQMSYPLAGAFVGYLIEQYGLVKFKELYRTNNYIQVYGMTIVHLLSRWQASLATTPLPESMQRQLAAKLVQPGIMQQRCAHESAYWRQLGYAVLEQQMSGQSANYLRQALQLSCGHPQDYLGLMLVLSRQLQPNARLQAHAISVILRQKNRYTVAAWSSLALLAMHQEMWPLAAMALQQAQRLEFHRDRWLVLHLLNNGEATLAKAFMQSLPQQRQQLLKNYSSDDPALQLWMAIDQSDIASLTLSSAMQLPAALLEEIAWTKGVWYFRHGQHQAAKSAFHGCANQNRCRVWLLRLKES